MLNRQRARDRRARRSGWKSMMSKQARLRAAVIAISLVAAAVAPALSYNLNMPGVRHTRLPPIAAEPSTSPVQVSQEKTPSVIAIKLERTAKTVLAQVRRPTTTSVAALSARTLADPPQPTTFCRAHDLEQGGSPSEPTTIACSTDPALVIGSPSALSALPIRH